MTSSEILVGSTSRILAMSSIGILTYHNLSISMRLRAKIWGGTLKWRCITELGSKM